MGRTFRGPFVGSPRRAETGSERSWALSWAPTSLSWGLSWAHSKALSWTHSWGQISRFACSVLVRTDTKLAAKITRKVHLSPAFKLNHQKSGPFSLYRLGRIAYRKGFQASPFTTSALGSFCSIEACFEKAPQTLGTTPISNFGGLWGRLEGSENKLDNPHPPH